MNEEAEINEIFEDIQNYLDCSAWQEFCSSLSNDQKILKTNNILISSIIQKVSKGILQPSLIFIKNDISLLVDSFILNPDHRFFNIASHLLNDTKNCTSIPFFELLLQKSPQTMISFISQQDEKIFTQYVRLLTKSYVMKENHIISEALCKYRHTLVLRELFLSISNSKINLSKYSYNYESLSDDTTQKFDSKTTVSLLFELWKINNKRNNLPKFYFTLKSESTVSFEFHLDNVINSILDFIQFGSDHQLFEYSIVFSEIYGKTADQYFVAILLERMNQTDATVFQTQIELIDREAAGPLRAEMRKSDRFQKVTSTNLTKLLPSLTDKDLLSLCAQFAQKGSIPEKIAQLHMFSRPVLVNKVAPDLRRLSKTHNSAKLLVEQLEKKKMIPIVVETPKYEAVIETLRDTDSTMAQLPEILAKVKPIEYAHKFFNAFNKALYLRHSDDFRSFIEKVTETVIYRLDDLNGFTAIALDFLKGCLCEQHRKSLSLIVVRCPIQRFVESGIFNHKKEIQIINDLHEAAILSCPYLTTKPVQTHTKAVYFNPLLILRLRWRNVRGDFSGNIVWFPEFVSLADNDVVKFLIWEANEQNPQNFERRSQILARLGITTNFEKIPSILHHLLMIENPEKTVVDALIPILMNCPIEKVSLPEKVNFSILFRVNSILWSKSVMSHPEVLRILRDKPSIGISQSLLMSCHLNSFNFVCFPIGFYALIVNSRELIGEKPKILEDASYIIECIESGTEFIIPIDFPKFAKISLVAFLAKRKVGLTQFFNHDFEFASICVFFLICFHRFSETVDLLNLDLNVIQFLLSNLAEGTDFVGRNKWAMSLIEFAFFCAANDVVFETDDWNRFISMVYKSEWPEFICDDHDNFVLINNYIKNIGL